MEAKLWKLNSCVLNIQLGQISREGITIRLEQKVLKTLEYFVEHAGEVVTKEQLIESVWGYDQVTDQSVARVISQLRKALGDSKEKPEYIETRPKVGYRFIASIDEEQEHSLDESRAYMGWVGPVILIIVLAVLGVVIIPRFKPERGSELVAEAQALLGMPSSTNTVKAFDLLKSEETDQLSEKHIALALIYGYKHGDFLGVNRNQRLQAFEYHLAKAQELGATESELTLIEVAKTYYLDHDQERAFLLLRETSFDKKDWALGYHLYALVQANRGHFNEALARMDLALGAVEPNQDMLWDHAWIYYLAGEQHLALERIAVAEKKYGEAAGWTKMLVLHALNKDLEAANAWLSRNTATGNYTSEELGRMHELLEKEDSQAFFEYLITINKPESSGRFEDPEAMAIWAITVGDETAGADYLGESLAMGYRFYTRWFSVMPVFKSLDLARFDL